MLFLGTLDDKTIEFPFGPRSNILLNSQKTILHHIIFGNEPLLIEEGFLLASEEALNPQKTQPFLLPAIENGLIKVASRYGDLHSYAEERRRNKHVSPPDNEFGKMYIERVQNACNDTQAFIKYPPPYIDEITFNRFLNIASSDYSKEIIELLDKDIPHNFCDIYEVQYLKGNKGKKWTARSAWEASVKEAFPDKPEVIFPMMALANRERQIIRAAAISKTNNIELNIETGFDNRPHDFTVSSNSTFVSDIQCFENYIYPNVSVDAMLRNINVFFLTIGDKNSQLSKYRDLYVNLLEDPMDKINKKSFERAASDYEREIYCAIGEEPIEKNNIINIVGTTLTGAITGGAISSVISVLSKTKNNYIFSESLKVKQSRRNFIKRACCVGLLTGLFTIDNKSGSIVEKGIRCARTTFQQDMSDIYLDHLKNLTCSHQVLKIDTNKIKTMNI